MWTIFYFVFLLLSLLIASLIYLINWSASMVKKMNSSKLNPYECGFSYITNPNLPFSLAYYLVTLVFLIFDIEVVMILPIVANLNHFDSVLYLFMISAFMSCMMITIMAELAYGMLEWVV